MKKSEDKISSIEPHIEGNKIVYSYPPDKLMQALFWIWDAFERTNMGMFLVYETAECVLQNKDMTGDKITVGVRDLEWISGSTTILKAFTGNPVEISINTEENRFEVFKSPFNEVPVYVYIFKAHPCITNTNQVFYRNEYFMLPNTYKEFINTYGSKP